MPDPSPSAAHFSNDPETAELIDELRQFSGATCAHCAVILCPHEIVASLAFGARRAPRCANCLAATLEQAIAILRSSLSDYIQARACYRSAWTWATSHRRADGPNSRCCQLAAL